MADSTRVAALKSARDAAEAKLNAAMTDSTAAGYQPDTVGGGATVDNDGYIRRLMDLVKFYDEQIALAEAQETGGIWIETHGVVDPLQ